MPQMEFHALGRGSATVAGEPTGNPTRNPFAYAGDTPTGTYVGTGIENTKTWKQGSYGPWGAVKLKAVSGDALVAQDIFGRKGLLIHGGSPGLFDGYRSTLGCIRLSNNDMRKMIQLISDAGNDAQAAMCEDVAVRVTIRE